MTANDRQPNVTHDQYANALQEAKAVLKEVTTRRRIVCRIPGPLVEQMFDIPRGAEIVEFRIESNNAINFKVVHPSFPRARDYEQYPIRVLDAFSDHSEGSMRVPAEVESHPLCRSEYVRNDGCIQRVPSRIGWLGILNRCLLQWLCVRLARKLDEDDKPVGWTLLRWVRPLSGYGGRPFVYMWKSEKNQ